MNEKFYSLPEEKQQKIINAGYRIFSQNSYKKSPVSEIACEAQISKALLFYYFKNKLELYLFLWEKCAEVTDRYLREACCGKQDDLFECMYRGMKAKIHLMKKYPDMAGFALRAFYEKEPEVQAVVQKSYRKYFNAKTEKVIAKLDPARFKEGLDIKMIYRNMYLSSLGYVFEMMQRKDKNPEDIEKDFTQMLEFWKTAYLRKEG